MTTEQPPITDSSGTVEVPVFNAGSFDVIVIGAGHAGIEAALSAARLGAKTLVMTMNLDGIGNCPCNPSIGGTAKGHLVREIDALGGEMAKTADACTIQSRMLNRGKGAAVHSLRVQIDRREYSRVSKKNLEDEEGLDLLQPEAVSIAKAGEDWSVATRLGAVYLGKAAILATGTFLRGTVHIGEASYASGPDGMQSADRLSASLEKLGIPLRRFKTGTPARCSRSRLKLAMLEEQQGDDPTEAFSFFSEIIPENKVICHIAWTNSKTHDIVKNSISRSPLYAGRIEGVGPRYCPSIEDKVMRFADKERHQLFIEPCGLDTQEMYLQGMSSSLPLEIQEAFYRSIEGLEEISIMRPAYAIEYDCVDPTALSATLEFKGHPGLYGAGQFNGSSGYEEAAAQGLMAGINAARSTLGKEPLVLSRAEAYIGVLIDDLVTCGCSDPYRMMTSRAEYRLALRQENADERLMPIGKAIGLIDNKRWAKYLRSCEQKQEERKRVRREVFHPSPQLNSLLVSRETSRIEHQVKLEELLKRPQICYSDLSPFDASRPSDLPLAVLNKVETELKYEGYLKKQEQQIKEAARLEGRSLPAEVDYGDITGLRLEAREKLNKVRPLNIGQASRISGVTPADINVLIIWSGRYFAGGEL
jgi:tRNA uridine 5-carboxymethylaminomethyl modification enzyme